MTTHIKQGRIAKEYIKQFVPEAPIIVEAGAHRGRDTLKLHKIWPVATIHAFEPVPQLYDILTQTVCEVPRVHCYPMALSDHNGTALMHVSSGASDAASSLLKPTGYLATNPHVVFSTNVEVPTVTLDTWAKQYAVSHIDFMWLDLQGAEMQVLQASPTMLKTVKALYTEINLEPRYDNSPSYAVYKTWLESQGFTLIQEDLAKQTWGNALFVRL